MESPNFCLVLYWEISASNYSGWTGRNKSQWCSNFTWKYLVLGVIYSSFYSSLCCPRFNAVKFFHRVLCNLKSCYLLLFKDLTKPEILQNILLRSSVKTGEKKINVVYWSIDGKKTKLGHSKKKKEKKVIRRINRESSDWVKKELIPCFYAVVLTDLRVDRCLQEYSVNEL